MSASNLHVTMLSEVFGPGLEPYSKYVLSGRLVYLLLYESIMLMIR